MSRYYLCDIKSVGFRTVLTDVRDLYTTLLCMTFQRTRGSRILSKYSRHQFTKELPTHLPSYDVEYYTVPAFNESFTFSGDRGLYLIEDVWGAWDDYAYQSALYNAAMQSKALCSAGMIVPKFVGKITNFILPKYCSKTRTIKREKVLCFYP